MGEGLRPARLAHRRLRQNRRCHADKVFAGKNGHTYPSRHPSPSAETDVFAKTRGVPRFSATPWLDCIPFKLRYLKYKVAELGYGSAMATVLFLCPSTGDRVPGWFADDGSGDSGKTYEG